MAICSIRQITPGDYYVQVSDATGGGGDNHWDFFFIIARDKATYETETEPNEDIGSANPLTLTDTQTSNDSPYSYVQAFGTAAGPNDVDWFSIANPYRSLHCWMFKLYASGLHIAA